MVAGDGGSMLGGNLSLVPEKDFYKIITAGKWKNRFYESGFFYRVIYVLCRAGDYMNFMSM